MGVPIAAGIAVLGTVLFCVLPGQLLGLFDADAGMLSMGIPALRSISVTFVFAAVTIILGYACSGLGNGVINMLGTGLRQVLILVPLLWLFTRIWGVSAAWYAFWVAEPAALVYAVLSSLRLLKKRGIFENE